VPAGIRTIPGKTVASGVWLGVLERVGEGVMELVEVLVLVVEGDGVSVGVIDGDGVSVDEAIADKANPAWAVSVRSASLGSPNLVINQYMPIPTRIRL